jgi:hypothetical protein
MTAIWCALAHWLIQHRTIGAQIRRYGQRVLPLVLIGLGVLIMSQPRLSSLVKLISGHGLRAGYVTSAAARNMPTYRIQSHTRHKFAEMVAGYIREADKRTKSVLDCVGF